MRVLLSAGQPSDRALILLALAMLLYTVAVHFAPLPQDSILPFDDTNEICVDFNVPEYIRSKTDLLITHTMKTIYQELQTSTPTICIAAWWALWSGQNNDDAVRWTHG